MPSFSRKSHDKISTCHADLQLIFINVVKGFDCTILEGHRRPERQEQLYNEGKSKVKVGKHNAVPSMAVDASPYPIPTEWGKDSRDQLEKFRYFAFYVVGVADTLYRLGKIDHKLRWGGDWNQNHDVLDNRFEDLVHFELI